MPTRSVVHGLTGVPNSPSPARSSKTRTPRHVAMHPNRIADQHVGKGTQLSGEIVNWIDGVKGGVGQRARAPLERTAHEVFTGERCGKGSREGVVPLDAAFWR